MPGYTLKGLSGPVVLIPIQSWSKTGGYLSEYMADGLYDDLTSIAGQLYQMGCIEYRIEPKQAPIWRITATFAARTPAEAANPQNPDAQISVTFEFPRNDLQRDIWNHPRVEVQIRKMDTANRARYRSDVEAWLRGDTQITHVDSTGKESTVKLSRAGLISFAKQNGADEGEIGAFLDDLTAGIETYIYSRRVLRANYSGPTASSLGKLRTNANRVYTKGGAVNEIKPPDWVSTKMPDGYWYKHEPEEIQHGSKLEVVQEWEFFGDLYSQFAYGTPIS